MFIELHDLSNGSILVNTDNVSHFQDNGSGTWVAGNEGGRTLEVKESYAEICAVIKTVMKAKYRRDQCTKDS